MHWQDYVEIPFQGGMSAVSSTASQSVVKPAAEQIQEIFLEMAHPLDMGYHSLEQGQPAYL